MDLYEVEMGLVSGTVIAVLAVVATVVMVFLMLNLRDLLNQVSPQNRAMGPNQVWLIFIPLFGYVWLIITVMKVRDSVRSEFQSRGWVPQGDLGYGVGLAFAILVFFAGLLTFIPLVVCLIMYWIRTAELKRQLVQGQPPAGWATLPAPPSYGTSAYSGGPTGQAAVAPQVVRQSCSSCGTTAERGDVFCRSCGASLEDLTPTGPLEPSVADQKTCGLCGAANRANARFCSSCGRPVA